MIIIQDVLVSHDIIEKDFVCNIKRCQGACCWEGDYGAPVSEEEKTKILELLPRLKEDLLAEAKEKIVKDGAVVQYKEPGFEGTNLLENGACVFMVRNELGHAQCSFEKLYNEGKSDFKKPVSCHLYPIRVSENAETGFKALNYDRWDICSEACSYGKELEMPLYQFSRDAIIRKFGEDFFEELHAFAEYEKGKKDQ